MSVEKNVAIIGRGNIVGKPLALALENKDATVSLLHSKTKDLKEYTKNADIVVAACGVPKLLKADMIKPGAVVIDVGISRTDAGIIGDIDFDNLKDWSISSEEMIKTKKGLYITFTVYKKN